VNAWRAEPALAHQEDIVGGYFTTERHDRLRESVREFAECRVRPLIPEMEASKAVQHTLSRLIAREGWIGVTIGQQYGGMGLGHLAKTIIIEELSRASGAMGAMVQASQLGVAKILHFGNEIQKKTWLPPIANGDCLPTIAVTEPDSGGFVLGMEASAQRDGDDYILNGRKVYIGNSHVGDLHGVVVRTGTGSKGLSAFLVESHRPGLYLAPHKEAMGLHGFSFGELIFDNCRVPAANRLGTEGDGLAVAYSSSVLYGRPNLTAVSLGIHRALVEETTAFAKARMRYDKPLGELPSIKMKLGQMQSRVMTAQLAAYHAAQLLDQGRPCDTELINAKLINVEYTLDSARNAMEVHGAAGLFTDRPVERYLRDAFHIFAPAGTSDIQLLRLGEAAMGTAKGQWSQRFAEASAAAAEAIRADETEALAWSSSAASAGLAAQPLALVDHLHHLGRLRLDEIESRPAPGTRLQVHDADRPERHAGPVDQRRAQVGPDAELVDHGVAREPRVVAHVVKHERQPAHHDVRAPALLLGHDPRRVVGRRHHARAHQRGRVQPGEVLPVLADEVHHRQRRVGRGGQHPREVVELRFRALAQAKLAQTYHPPGCFLVHRGE
jgi:acyl-CoA dehydrogenase